MERTNSHEMERVMKNDKKMVDYYDFLLNIDEYWENTTIKPTNYGYWDESTSSVYEANVNLVEKLLEYIPDKDGNILDVACGVGLTTRQICSHYAPSNVTAINISPTQIKQAEINAPDCSFHVMDAADISVPDNSFDNIICVEAAFHFDSREKFFKEAFRILKPGGRLVMADILFKSFLLLDKKIFPSVNKTRSVKEYEEKLQSAGFNNIILDEVTPRTFHPYRANMKKFRKKCMKEFFRNPAKNIQLIGIALYAIVSRSINIDDYYLVSAQKL